VILCATIIFSTACSDQAPTRPRAAPNPSPTQSEELSPLTQRRIEESNFELEAETLCEKAGEKYEQLPSGRLETASEVRGYYRRLDRTTTWLIERLESLDVPQAHRRDFRLFMDGLRRERSLTPSLVDAVLAGDEDRIDHALKQKRRNTIAYGRAAERINLVRCGVVESEL
jgi:hypothetical protein